MCAYFSIANSCVHLRRVYDQLDDDQWKDIEFQLKKNHKLRDANASLANS